MFLVNWFKNVLNYLGLFPKNAKIAFLGLDNAGKTTLLQIMKEGRTAANPPTLHPHAEELMIHNIRFRTIDLGGHETARRIWKDYTSDADGIVFLCDAADRTRFQEAQEELSHLLDDPCLANVPICVLGNKIDIPVAASEDELRRSIGLPHHMTTGPGVKMGEVERPVALFMCSVIKGMGYVEGFKWLAQHVKTR